MKQNAPDGGWGWAVVFAYFCISVVSDGIRYSFGVMFISLLEAFGRGKGETAWVGGLLAGTCNAVGPLVTKMVDRFGCRTVAMAGSLIASAGLLFSVFAQELYHLYITLGVMTGFGYGMIFLASIVSVSRYFDKRRSLAMGISVCGSGIGSIVFNPLSKWLLDEYGWRGTLLIEAGLVLNCVAFSALYRPLPDNPCGTEVNQQNNILLANVFDTKESRERINCVENTEDSTLNCSECLEKRHTDINGALNNELDLIRHYDLHVPQKEVPNGEINEFSTFLIDNKEQIIANKDVPTKSTEMSTLASCIKCSKELFRFSLLKDPSFLVFFLSGFLVSLAYNVPYTYLPDLANSLGYSVSEGVLLISYLGIANTLGRVLFGILGDIPKVNRTYVYNVTNMICGIFTAFVALFTNYGLLVMYAVVYGLTTGGYVSLSTLVAGDLFSLEVITESVGLFMLACGLASFIGTPLAGWLFDITRNYAMSFIYTGVMLVLSGAIVFIIPCIRRQKYKASAEEQNHV